MPSAVRLMTPQDARRYVQQVAVGLADPQPASGVMYKTREGHFLLVLQLANGTVRVSLGDRPCAC